MYPGTNELEALRRIGRELNSTLDLRQVLDLLVLEGLRVTAAARGIALVMDNEQGLQPYAWHGYTAQEAAARAQSQGLPVCQTTREALLSEDGLARLR